MMMAAAPGRCQRRVARVLDDGETWSVAMSTPLAAAVAAAIVVPAAAAAAARALA